MWSVVIRSPQLTEVIQTDLLLNRTDLKGCPAFHDFSSEQEAKAWSMGWLMRGIVEAEKYPAR